MLFRASTCYLMVLLAAVCNGLLYPGQPTPDFSVPTLRGINFTNTNIPSEQRAPIMFYRYDERSLFLQAEWNSNSSVTAFVKYAPDATHFVFFASQNSKENVWRLRDRLAGAARVLGNDGLLDRCHFVPVPPESVTPWINEVFQKWNCSSYGCHAHRLHFTKRSHHGSDVDLLALRLDARYECLPSPKSLYNKTLPVVLVEDMCKDGDVEPELRRKEPGNFGPPPWMADKTWTPPIVNNKSSLYGGKVVVTSSKGCSFYAKMKYASKNGAIGVVFYAAEGEPVTQLAWNTMQVETPGSMISFADGMKLKDLLSVGDVPVHVQYETKILESIYFGSDHHGDLAEGGLSLYASLVFLDYQAQWFEYAAKLQRRISESAKVIPVLDDVVMQGWPGAVGRASLPPYSVLRHYSKVEALVYLKCPGHFNADCAAWDRTMELTVCCTGQKKPYCNYELGRYITTFSRGIGHWITDISPLLPLLNSSDGRCNFTMRTDTQAKPWVVSLLLLLTRKAPACGNEDCENSKDDVTVGNRRSLAPESMLSVVRGTTGFDKHYNNRTAVKFRVPQKTLGVRLVSVISGHGSDNNGCGEFCVTKHVFTVNEKYNNSLTFSDAGSPLGCARKVPHGVVPNQYGTWMYGRDGWCDGQEIEPWVVDITNQTNLNPSATNTILYQGYFKDRTPNPTRSPGVMTVFSELVFYTAL